MQTRGIRGFLIDSPTPGILRAVRDGAILIQEGRIIAVGSHAILCELPEASGINWLHSGEFVIVPGLIDIHAHLPQYPSVARTESGLLPWLERHIFPLEREFNAGCAAQLAPRFYEALAKNGTTCAMLYAAIYEESCDTAFAAAATSGMRIILGKVMMDDGSYGGLSKDKILDLSLAQSERLCRKWHGHDDGRLSYAFSPRFAVTCSREMMSEAALLARKYDAFVQTHLSENHDEIATVRRKFPECASYTDVYASCGLLGDRTVLGHCIHVASDEIAQLVEAHAVVAHCPTSNLFLNSGIMPLDTLQDAGLRIGIGSDVAGGPELNLWQVMRSTIESQKARAFYVSGTRVPSAADVFHLATQGGADALGFGSQIGTLDIGKEADFVVLDPRLCLPMPKVAPHPLADFSAEELLTLFIYRGGPHAVVETFVRGKSLFRAPEPLLL